MKGGKIMTNTLIAGFITPSKKELSDWVKRNRSAGYIVHTFFNSSTRGSKKYREYWGVVIGKLESK